MTQLCPYQYTTSNEGRQACVRVVNKGLSLVGLDSSCCGVDRGNLLAQMEGEAFGRMLGVPRGRLKEEILDLRDF